MKTQTYKSTNIQNHKHTKSQTYKNTNIQAYKKQTYENANLCVASSSLTTYTTLELDLIVASP